MSQPGHERVSISDISPPFRYCLLTMGSYEEVAKQLASSYLDEQGRESRPCWRTLQVLRAIRRMTTKGRLVSFSSP